MKAPIVFSLPGEYSGVFVSTEQDLRSLMTTMKSQNWSARGGGRQLSNNAFWYEFYCDAVTVPIELHLAEGMNIEHQPFVRVLRFHLESDGSPFYFWGIGSPVCDNRWSFVLPPGRFEVLACAFNPAKAIDRVDIPNDYRDFEHHRFYVFPCSRT